MDISVIVPVFNSRETLAELCRRIGETLESFTPLYEIILVDDASRDGSWDEIRRLSAENPAKIHGIGLFRNYGQHNALLCGIRSARYDIIITLDDDLQNPPEEIPTLIEKLKEGHDVVYGCPKRECHGLWRNLASVITKLALKNTMGAQTARRVSAFRGFRTNLREAFADYRGPYVSIDVLLTWGTTRFAAVKVDHHPRAKGNSQYTFRKLVAHALNMTTGFSTTPLRVASLAGFFFTLFGIGILIYVIGRYYLSGSPVPGFPFLASIIAIFSGAQLFALGIIGEYLARMHFRLMDRPSFVVRDSTEDREEKRDKCPRE